MKLFVPSWEKNENYQLLVKFLGNHYPITIFNDITNVDPSFDLCIIDTLHLKGYQKHLKEIKLAENSVFVPVLLLASNQSVTQITENLWQIVDDIINIPIKKMELLAKIEILLRSRRLSLHLKEANEKLQEANQFKTRFMSIAAHDLRNHLSGVIGGVECIKLYQNKDSLSSEGESLLNIISSSANNMLSLLEELLIIGRSEEGRLEFNPHSLDLEAFCQDIVLQLSFNLPKKYNVKLRKNGQIPLEVNMDTRLLNHILNNLISNAIKYSPDGGEITLHLESEPEKVRLTIQDQGIGIPKDKQERLFEAFYRADNVAGIEGNGLGLAIVKQSVDLHGGEIYAESEVGIGTKFVVTLPC